MNGTEEWEDTAKRVATNVLGAINASAETIEIVEKLIRDRVFMPGGRYLYAAGREFHQTQNCFSAETRIITDKGIFSFEELAGTAVNVLNKYGEWEQAEIHCFGEQDLLKLTLENDDEIFVTENHRWWQSDGSRVTTNELKEVMLLEPKMDIELDEIGIRHGIIFGDGHLIFRNMNLGVRSIEETNRTELVYCAVVKGSESFTLANGVVTSNCLLMRAEDSREGWADLMAKSAMALQTGAGIGIDYSLLRGAGAPIRRTGGVASGPISLMKMINEIGRGVMQGGSRRCIPEGGHIMTSNGVMRVEDVVEGDFVVTTSGMREVIGTVSQGKQKTVVVKTRLGQMKITGNHRVAVLTSPTTYGWVNAADLKPEHRLIAMPEIVAGSPQELPAPSNDGRGRNSVIPMMPKLDTEVAWFIGYIAGNGNASYSEYTNDRGYKFHKGRLNITVPSHRTSVIERLSKCFDMFGVNHSVSDYDTYVVLKCTHSAFGKWMFDNVKQPNTTIRVPDWILQAPPEIRGAFVAGVVDSDGSYETRPLNAVTTVYPEFCEDIQSVLMSLGVLSRMKKFERENPEWKTRYSLGVVSSTEVDKFNQMVGIHAEKGQYVSAGSKRQFGYTYPWEMKDSLPKIHSNKGCGFNYETVASKIDTLGVPIEVLSVEEGDVVETFDLQVDGVAEFSYNGIIVHNSAIWAGLSWDHPDVHAFIHAKDWSDVVRKQKEIDFNFPGDLDMTNISVILDKEFFDAYYDELHPKHQIAVDVYWDTTRQMLSTAEPGFSINYENKNESLRNACTEVTSEDDSDICNLGSINLANINSEDEMRHAVKYGTLFLLAGTVYSELPYEKVEQVRSKNRRLGLGLMGIHEWLVSHGKKYNPDEDLRKLLEIYATSGEFADWFADELGLSRPVKTRAIAPTGTIAIVAETTSGIEPIFCVAYKRRYKESRPDGKDITKFQYVIDPTAKRLIDKGVHPDSIEDAYSLSLDIERRVVMQHWLQRFVDHGISSTINLHDRITDEKEVRWFGEMLLKYLPGLRGITCYPDGARGGQPLSVVSYKTAMGHEGVVFEESEERCVGGACGI